MRFWVHVRQPINETRMKRLQKGDRVLFYAPHPDQRFNAIGSVVEDGKIEITPAALEAPIHPLIESLDFIRDKQQWGWVFRRGFFEISEPDFERIAAALSAESSLLAAVQ